MKHTFLALAVAGLFVTAVGAAPKPNVLFIAVDDLKPNLGCYGDTAAKTPNIDRLAARGTLFERAYCMQAVCAPSRNAMLTGLRPQVLRIYDLGTNFRQSVPDVETLPQWFKEHGYKAEGMGKIYHVGHGNHEDPASWSVPHWQGKSVAYVLPENRDKMTREGALFENKFGLKDLPKGAPMEAADVADDAYPDGQIANEAIQRLRAAKDKPGTPFFIAVGFLRPHLPFCAPKKYWDLHDPAKLPQPTTDEAPKGAPKFAPTTWGELRNYSDIPETGPLDAAKTRQLIHGYYAATSFTDAQVGRVMDELDHLGLAESTIIVLWGDHGWHLGDHGMWCKHTDYEQATHAPLIIAAPGFQAGQRRKAITEFIDVYPTLCDLAGLEKPSHLQGASLAALMKNESATAKTAAFQVYPRGSKETGPLLGQAVRTDRWRYVEWQKADGSVAARELYDMQDDPGETVNVAEDPKQAETIQALSATVRKQLAEPPPAGLKMLPMGKDAPAKPALDRAALFLKKDKNQDGKLTHEEFMADQPDPPEAEKRWIKFDTDKNGELSREEFISAGAVKK